eukprot:m.470254 g.470254  ORF g.470254 m.470254 type:complete len:294 (+) comp57097_c0_seq22:155-1036(+)
MIFATVQTAQMSQGHLRARMAISTAQTSTLRLCLNDGVCDCCDGSDEFDGSCGNDCYELGLEARKELELRRAHQTEGYKTRLQLRQSGMAQHVENSRKMAELQRTLTQLSAEVAAAEEAKKTAEETEKAAVDQFNAAWEVTKQQLETDKKRAAFDKLDMDKNEFISPTEVRSFSGFDTDGDAHVSELEALTWMNGGTAPGEGETPGLIEFSAAFQTLFDTLPESLKNPSQVSIEKPSFSIEVQTLVDSRVFPVLLLAHAAFLIVSLVSLIQLLECCEQLTVKPTLARVRPTQN